MDPTTDETSRSVEACPACGAHRLAVLDLPTTPATGYRAYDELIGLRALESEPRPAIGCLACGAEWPDLQAFRAASGGEAP